MARVPGLSRYDKPDPLLRMVGNKARIERGETAATTSSDLPRSPDEVARPKFIAPGSDDESIGSTSIKSYRPARVIPSRGMDDLDSESDDTIRGNIQSTSFSTTRPSSRSMAPKPTLDTTESKSEERAAALPNRKRKVLHSEGKGPQSSASTESTPPPLSQTPSSSGSHLHDEFGFPKKRNPSKSATTYGKRTTLEKKFGNRARMDFSFAGYGGVVLIINQLQTNRLFVGSRNRAQVVKERLPVDLNSLLLHQPLMPRISPRINSESSSMAIQHRRSQGPKHQIVANKGLSLKEGG
jgi:hypothetical protein